MELLILILFMEVNLLFQERNMLQFYVEISTARTFQLEATHGYVYAINRLKTLAITDPEAAFRLAVVFIHKNDLINADFYFQKAITLEQNSKSKKYTTIIKFKYLQYIYTNIECKAKTPKVI